MKQTVHILATVRKPALLDAALLTFRTLRVGFPTATVKVWGNGPDEWGATLLNHAAANAGGEFRNLPPTSHDAWIESLIEESVEPFWICDTDLVFWQPVEAWFDTSLIVPSSMPSYSGRYEPEFNEEWTDTLHVERLHTCLMWFNPGPLRAAMRQAMSQIPAPWGNTADFPFIRQHIIARKANTPLFYDTCAGLYHALNNVEALAFIEKQNACFDHLHCATYADALANTAFQEMHARVYRDIEAARGIRQQQDAYYASRAVKPANKRKVKHAV